MKHYRCCLPVLFILCRLIQPSCDPETNNNQAIAAPPIYIWLVGKTGHGRSSTGNTILGSQVFKHDVSASSTTSKAQFEKSTLHGGRYVKVLDLPGFYDTHDGHQESAVRIVRGTKQMPAPNAVLFVFSIAVRFTEEEYKTFQRIKNLFDNEITNHMIVVFTRKDELVAENKTVEEYLATAPNCLKRVLEECGGRYVFFNNRAADDAQVNPLLEKIDSISIGEAHYRNPYESMSDADLIERVREKLDLSEKEEVEKTSNYQLLKNENTNPMYWVYGCFGAAALGTASYAGIVPGIVKVAEYWPKIEKRISFISDLWKMFGQG